MARMGVIPDPAATRTTLRVTDGWQATVNSPIGAMTSNTSPTANSVVAQVEKAPSGMRLTPIRSPSPGAEQIE